MNTNWIDWKRNGKGIVTATQSTLMLFMWHTVHANWSKSQCLKQIKARAHTLFEFSIVCRYNQFKDNICVALFFPVSTVCLFQYFIHLFLFFPPLFFFFLLCIFFPIHFAMGRKKIIQTIEFQIAGTSTEFVNKVLEKVKCGIANGGLFEI